MKFFLKIDSFQTKNSLMGGGKFSLLKIAFSFVFLTMAMSCSKESVPALNDANGFVQTRTHTECACEIAIGDIQNVEEVDDWNLVTTLPPVTDPPTTATITHSGRGNLVRNEDFILIAPPSHYEDIQTTTHSQVFRLSYFTQMGASVPSDFTVTIWISCDNKVPVRYDLIWSSANASATGTTFPNGVTENFAFFNLGIDCNSVRGSDVD